VVAAALVVGAVPVVAAGARESQTPFSFPPLNLNYFL